MLLGYLSPLIYTLGNGQVVLVNVADASGELLGMPLTVGPVAQFELELPFDTAQRKAVEIAIEEAKDEGTFTGLIPKGSYTFAGQPFMVEPGISVRIEVSPRVRRQGVIQPVIIYRDTPGSMATDP